MAKQLKQQKKRLSLKTKSLFAFKNMGDKKGMSTDPTITVTTTIFFNK